VRAFAANKKFSHDELTLPIRIISAPNGGIKHGGWYIAG